MRAWSRYIGIGVALGIVAALVPFMGSRSVVEAPESPLGKAQRALFSKPVAPDFSSLDLTRIEIRPERVIAPMQNGTVAELSLDPALQRAVSSLMRRFRMPEAGTVMMDVHTGKLLVYSSFVKDGEPFDVNTRAQAPAASVFKVITGAALVERANLNADTKQCYHGGRSRISRDELREDPAKDKWCATLGEAMGRSSQRRFRTSGAKAPHPRGRFPSRRRFWFWLRGTVRRRERAPEHRHSAGAHRIRARLCRLLAHDALTTGRRGDCPNHRPRRDHPAAAHRRKGARQGSSHLGRRGQAEGRAPRRPIRDREGTRKDDDAHRSRRLRASSLPRLQGARVPSGHHRGRQDRYAHEIRDGTILHVVRWLRSCRQP
ncbi:MAG: hypothetical protein QM784_28315 [Polyangiaceae bacterium]